MTEKKQRFENRLDKNNIKFNTINPVWDNWQETALNVFEMIDLLNEQSDELVEYCNFSLHDLLDKKNKEIEQLKKTISMYSDATKSDMREIKELMEDIEELQKENEQLKETNDFLSDFRGFITVDHQKTKEENEKLKSDRVRFEEETRLEITRRLDKVFNCIDKKINNLQRKYDFGQQEAGACPMHNLKHSINTLKELKKELEE